jgi:hypothetical protein
VELVLVYVGVAVDAVVLLRMVKYESPSIFHRFIGQNFICWCVTFDALIFYSPVITGQFEVGLLVVIKRLELRKCCGAVAGCAGLGGVIATELVFVYVAMAADAKPSIVVGEFVNRLTVTKVTRLALNVFMASC